jgi:ATP-dependent DNA helicase PIF1
MVTFEDDLAKAQASAYDRYKQRLTPKALRAMKKDPVDLTGLTLLDWLQYFEFYTWKRRRTAKPRIINYFPRYKADPSLDTYEDYCRVKLMLHHAFTEADDLLRVDSFQATTFTAAFRECKRVHVHSEPDFLDDPPKEDDEATDDSDVFEDVDEGIQSQEEADFEVYSRRRCNENLVRNEDPDGLGDRDLDRDYNWAVHCGHLQVDHAFWDTAKAITEARQSMPNILSIDVFNEEQQLFNSLIVNHWQDYLAGRNPRPLRVNVDGLTGTWKSFVILQASAKVVQLAAAVGVPDPIIRSAPTGIAAYNFNGRTLHSVFRLHVKGAFVPLPPATLQSLQAVFRHTKYLIVDEKSMSF